MRIISSSPSRGNKNEPYWLLMVEIDIKQLPTMEDTEKFKVLNCNPELWDWIPSTTISKKIIEIKLLTDGYHHYSKAILSNLDTYC